MVGESRWFRRLQLRRLKRLAVLLIPVLTIILAVGCSRPSELPVDEGLNHTDQRKAPFQDNAIKQPGPNSGDGKSSDAGAEQSSSRDPRRASGPPFQDLSSVSDLPPGTLVTVKLERQISSDNIGDKGTFAAMVDEPVMLDGKIAVPRGANVTGRIESAQAFDAGRGLGYIRLTLETITIAGKKLPLRTSSLFVRGSSGEVSSTGQDDAEQTRPTVTRLQKGRRLTFRLAATVPLYRQDAEFQSKDHLPGTE